MSPWVHLNGILFDHCEKYVCVYCMCVSVFGLNYILIHTCVLSAYPNIYISSVENGFCSTEFSPCRHYNSIFFLLYTSMPAYLSNLILITGHQKKDEEKELWIRTKLLQHICTFGAYNMFLCLCAFVCGCLFVIFTLCIPTQNTHTWQTLKQFFDAF